MHNEWTLQNYGVSREMIYHKKVKPKTVEERIKHMEHEKTIRRYIYSNNCNKPMDATGALV